MYDITLYGHLVVDKVFGDVEYSTLGGIANVWQDLVTNNGDLKIRMEPLAFGEALIYVNQTEGKRYSKFCPNQVGRIANVVPTKLAHIAYLDKIKSSQIEEIRRASQIVTADICSKDTFDHQLLTSVDILFCSESCYNASFDLLVKKIVVHRPDGSCVFDGKDYREFKVIKKEGLNVLGMGDKFAAKTISQLVRGATLFDSVGFAHAKLSEEI